MALPDPGVPSRRVPTCCTVVCTQSPTCTGTPLALAAGWVGGGADAGGDASARPALAALEAAPPLFRPQAARAIEPATRTRNEAARIGVPPFGDGGTLRPNRAARQDAGQMLNWPVITWLPRTMTNLQTPDAPVVSAAFRSLTEATACPFTSRTRSPGWK